MLSRHVGVGHGLSEMRNGNGNGNNNNGNGNGDSPRRKPVTRDDLAKSIEAAKHAAEAAAQAAGAVQAALGGEIVDGDGPPPDVGPSDGAPTPQRTGGHAFEEFMARLKGALDKAGDAVQVSENAAWVKIESRKNGHKVYVAKGKTMVNRVESTLPPSAVKGATEPGRTNGRIASWIPAEVGAVSQAIERLASEEGQIRPPLRGGGGAAPPRGGGPSGSGSGGGGRRTTGTVS